MKKVQLRREYFSFIHIVHVINKDSSYKIVVSLDSIDKIS